MNKFSKLISALFVITIILFAIAAAFFKTILEPYYIPVFPYMLLFFFIVNSITLYFKFNALNVRPESFPRKLMAINGLRIFVYILFMGIYLFFSIETSTPFLIGFLVCYFVYFAFDLAISNKLR